MLLWETLTRGEGSEASSQDSPVRRAARGPRLPYDRRCAALTLRGSRCRCRIREGSDFCQFHDPKISAERRRLTAAKGGRNSRKLSHIPGGYLRKLTNRTAVGQAMDRLYREVRLGMVTPEMGRVLFDILTRMLDSGLCDGSKKGNPQSPRARANRLRPKVSEMLSHAEKTAWQKALANAPADIRSSEAQERQTPSVTEQDRQPERAERVEPRHELKLQAVS